MHFNATVPAELRYRDVIGALVRAICQQAQSRARNANVEWTVMSAFHEAYNNVCKHAYERDARGPVEVEMCSEETRLVLAITDRGHGFDFDTRSAGPLPAIDALDRGGMGLFIIRRAMSRVQYVRGASGAGNTLTMIMDLVPGAGSPKADPRENEDEEPSC